jgi:hypothetical protein
VASVDLAAWFVAEAAGAYGGQVLADASPGPAGPRAVRPRTRPADLRLHRCGCRPPGALAAVIDRPGRRDAGDALEIWIGDGGEQIPAWRLRWPKCPAGITGSSLIAVTRRPLLDLVTRCGGTSCGSGIHRAGPGSPRPR